MKPASKKFTALAATAFAFAFTMAAHTAHAEDYCITSGAHAAHGCGFPSMEMCRQAANGIGGICTPNPSSQSASNTGNAFASQPQQPRGGRHLRNRH